MKVLGISVGHDKGAAMIVDGKVVVAITQERLTRIKHDGAYSNGTIPIESITYCLNVSGVNISEIDFVVYSTTETFDYTYPYLSEQFDIPEEKVMFIPHHLAHAYSSFFSSGFDEAAVIVADASGSQICKNSKLNEWYKTKHIEYKEFGQNVSEGISIYHFTKSKYTEVYKKWISINNKVEGEESSLGLMYSDGSLQLIYDPKAHSWPAGKLMGLASYADPLFVNQVPQVIKKDGNDIHIPYGNIFPRVNHTSSFHAKAQVAGLYQREQENASLYLAEIAKDLTKSKNVCTAGGSFLNCNSNEKILKSGLFEDCYFLPPADDSGIPLGCAWFAYQKMTEIGETKPFLPYTGKSYKFDDISLTLKSMKNIDFQEYSTHEEMINFIADRLADNRVIGWFQGGSELGPRALGNRSILASPKPKWMKDHINHDVKKREWYRPFAPAVLYERQYEIFDTNYFSPNMLVTATVNESWRDRLHAVTHVDYSSRYQSVTRSTNERFYNLISKFDELTGIPVLLNTSFNGPSEPIVETPYDAVRCLLEQNLDFLAIENFVVWSTLKNI